MVGNATDIATKKNNQAVRYLLQENISSAKELLKEVVKHSPQFLPALYNLGKLLLLEKSYEKAFFLLQRAKNLLPQYAKIWELIGDTLYKRKKFSRARYYYKEAFKRNPYSLSPVIKLSYISMEEKNFSQARDYLLYALSVDPSYNDAYIGLGILAYLLGRYYEAILHFQKVEEKRPYDKRMHFYFAEALFKVRAYPLAQKEYQKAKKFYREIGDITSLTYLERKEKLSQKLAIEEAIKEEE